MRINEIKTYDCCDLLEQIRAKRFNSAFSEKPGPERTVSDLMTLLAHEPSNPLTPEDEQIVKELSTKELNDLFLFSTNTPLIMLWMQAVLTYLSSTDTRYTRQSAQNRSQIGEVLTSSSTNNDTTFGQSGQNDPNEQQDATPNEDELSKDEKKE